MQLTINIPSSIESVIKALAQKNGKKESEIITSALLAYFLTPQAEPQNFGQGWQQMYEALNDFEPNFVLEREVDIPQERQTMEF